jgi:CDP-paratose 2-epimerase
MRIVVTGGAGFVGSNVAVGLATRHPDWSIVAFDNLRRRGSELTLARLKETGVSFVHGDVRHRDDLASTGALDAMVECSAEPSALAGVDGGLDYLVGSNLFGAYSCLEHCRLHDAAVVFLSTSRVYPVATLAQLGYVEGETRLELLDEQPVAGASVLGITESFPLEGPRTFYGATKLAAEILIAEYVETFGLRAVINRCGVIAGPWQMGKVDQGVFTYWLLAHQFGRPLAYLGYDGKQVRDLLHVGDLCELIELQLLRPAEWQGVVANVGGGRSCSLSLIELTALCREITGRRVEVTRSSAHRPGDVPVYISDCSRLFELTEWRPSASPEKILRDTYDWIVSNEEAVGRALEIA